MFFLDFLFSANHDEKALYGSVLEKKMEDQSKCRVRSINMENIFIDWAARKCIGFKFCKWIIKKPILDEHNILAVPSVSQKDFLRKAKCLSKFSYIW